MVPIWEALAEKGDVMEYTVSVFKKVFLNFKTHHILKTQLI